ncbi:sensor domain-containing diguanylate cyclase [Stenotrophomonas rhizophila]|uniref:sensor domain-containing diguanylate cyclase n=1 Tax=Stenotrophomonas rhizophila TaxID=216778 RepID=UPI001E332704|nr:diguanylate cyclase [Stenotrophomonas rhizophila]
MCWLLAWLLLWPGVWQASAAALDPARVGHDVLLLGAATAERTPQRACSAEVLAHHQQLLAVPAPADGWSGEPQAVDVFGVLSGEVRISYGDREICGSMHDARTRDSRFRAGIGMVVVPPAGGREPIMVAWATPLKPRWIPTVELGGPSPVQQNDTARLLVRAACIAVAIALALSALFGYVTAKDRSFLVFVAVCLVFVLWQAVLGGLSGYPEPWLPVDDRASWWLVALTAFTEALLLPILWRLNGGDRLWPGSRGAQQGVLWGLIVVGLCVPWMGLAALGWWAAALETLYLAGCAVCLGVGLWALLRRDRYALAGLSALAPWWVMIIADALHAQWVVAYRIEALQLSATWFLMMSAYALNLRLGRLRQQRDEMRQLADTDALTGLPNRRAGLRLLAEYLQRARQEQQPLAIGFLDIDLFKDINDQFGHDVGDQVLVAVARGLRGAVRNRDDVIRMGGEEFLVLLPGTNRLTALARLESVRQQVVAVRQALAIPGLNVSASIGLAVLRGPSDDLPALLRRADHAMYCAKRAGRNQVYDAEQPAAASDPLMV